MVKSQIQQKENHLNFYLSLSPPLFFALYAALLAKLKGCKILYRASVFYQFLRMFFWNLLLKNPLLPNFLVVPKVVMMRHWQSKFWNSQISKGNLLTQGGALYTTFLFGTQKLIPAYMPSIIIIKKNISKLLFIRWMLEKCTANIKMNPKCSYNSHQSNYLLRGNKRF